MGLAPVFLTRGSMMLLPGFVGLFLSVTGALIAAVIFRIDGERRFAEGVGLAISFKAIGNFIEGPAGG